MKPYVHLNAAMTADGKIASKDSTLKISGPDDLIRVHKLRKKYDGIMVGINTILVDNPRLSIHKIESTSKDNPTRIVIDSHARTPIDSRVLNEDAQTIIVTTKNADENKIKQLSAKATIITAGDTRVNLTEAMEKLYELGIKSILLEGGATLNYSMFEAKLIDYVSVCIGSKILGGKDSVTLVDGEGFDKNSCIKLELNEFYRLDKDLVVEYDVIY